MTAPYATADDVRARVCGAKIRHHSEGAARRHAEALNLDHPDAGFSHYPCPFSEHGSIHWHAGHTPSLEGLEAIARVMRGLDPTPPIPHDPPPRLRRRRRTLNRKEGDE